ncbi:MAG: hypothetical protein QY306_02315 [Anaerolineales bacterium]|nr:MAG: hypothetical protein QY306_02315 [Anaerolineales bacterium]
MTYSLIFTILIEGTVVLGYSILAKRPASPLLWASLVVNIFTQSLLWISLQLFFRYYLATLFVAEILIWLIESFLLQRLSNGKLNLRDACALSFCMNASSFGIGWFLPI